MKTSTTENTSSVLLSVIIPVYNGEEFIARAVNSVLPQLHAGVELILVDDGSTDNSGKICDAFSNEHEYIHVIHKENGGLSSARNAGIDMARGKYLHFLDADDYMDSNAYENIANVIIKNQPDCIDFGWKYVSRNGSIHESLHKNEKEILFQRAYIEDTILPPLLNLRKDDDHFVYNFAWTRVYKSEIIRRCGVRFDESRRVWEDRLFVVQYLKYCNSYYCMKECFYNYCDTPDSLSRKYSLQFFDIIIANFAHYKSLFADKYDFDTPFVNQYWSHAIENMVFRSLEEKENCDAIRQNIIRALSNEQVAKWFSKRIGENHFEKRISGMIACGNAEGALECFVKEKKKRAAQTSFRRKLQNIRARL